MMRKFITSKNKRKQPLPHCLPVLAKEEWHIWKRCGQIAASSILCISLLLNWFVVQLRWCLALKDGDDNFGRWVSGNHRRQSYMQIFAQMCKMVHTFQRHKKCLQQQPPFCIVSDFQHVHHASVCSRKWGPSKNQSSVSYSLEYLHSTQIANVFFDFIFVFFCIYILFPWQHREKKRKEIKVKTCKCFPSFQT